jgi:glutamyl-tRNA synthetase
MAPSPTGEFHIGGMRTLLYNYAFAKNQGGKFILRVEDTDRARYVEGAVERLLQVIEDYGFGIDEGPFVQSERLDIYKKHATELVEKGAAYYCFCSSERLGKLREEQRSEGLPVTKYDRHCLGLSKEEVEKKLSAGEKFVIRLKVPDGEVVEFEDVVLGKVSFPSKDIDDQVLMKSDGFPTYHLAVVIDDHLMKISHVIRGGEWLPSTPKHILLYRAFGWDLPAFVHVPLLKESNSNKKLSKRDGSVASQDFLKEGYLPEALNNFLMFLGWNPGTEKEVYSLDEFVKDFSLEKIQKTDLVSFDREKLLWVNGTYIRGFSLEDLWGRIEGWAKKFDVELCSAGKTASPDFNLKVLGLIQERLKVLSEFNDLAHYFYEDPKVGPEVLKFVEGDGARKDTVLKSFLVVLESISSEDWERDHLEKLCHDLLESEKYTPKEAFMTLRVGLTGETKTPQIFDILEVLGKETVVRRLKTQLSS